jgi:hypothetical protein
LAHELAHCYFLSQGQVIRNAVKEQGRAIGYENILSRALGECSRGCSKTSNYKGQVVSWDNDQIRVKDMCECDPSGKNGPTTCPNPGPNTLCCSNRCVYDSQSNTNNCGTCNNNCALLSKICCSGNCTDTRTDPRHCGSCSHDCTLGGANAYCCNGADGIYCVNPDIPWPPQTCH